MDNVIDLTKAEDPANVVSFADAPVSIAERRASRAHDGSLWTPRDALVDLLRQIDRGEVKVDEVVISYRESDAHGTRTRFIAAGGDLLTGLGLLTRTMFLVQNSE